MARNCLVIDCDRCIGCRSCEVACKNENDIALGEYWNKVLEVGPLGTFPDVEQYYLPMQCQQCTDAPCVHVCPTGASYRNEDNVVLIDKAKCIGCKYCMMACPYGVRAWNTAEQCAEKCTLCMHRDTPKCVANCPGAARLFGDLDDQDSDAAKAIASADPAAVHYLVDSGNHPSTAYILSPKNARWIESTKLVMDNPKWRNSPWIEREGE